MYSSSQNVLALDEAFRERRFIWGLGFVFFWLVPL
jgi:hypothetical protein